MEPGTSDHGSKFTHIRVLSVSLALTLESGLTYMTKYIRCPNRLLVRQAPFGEAPTHPAIRERQLLWRSPQNGGNWYGIGIVIAVVAF